ncbi:hypothetical protein P5808_21645 [Bacillus cereus]|uniref:hypothetical protein n=1 Tax=Bacillus cereus TaxID=1396 RepID=UPI0024067CFF|nr:hypothetical protein [Bacillus cereus]MDF9506804.1 hypothetical protein [Bacillus cereus]MDF9596610.1 hypothetical protein [Bacillus cereus]MDF9610216.1 hypothetical protein [Bacillus cereus]MDF9661118.1 hypothetical protein [Bacillus cereus]
MKFSNTVTEELAGTVNAVGIVEEPKIVKFCKKQLRELEEECEQLYFLLYVLLSLQE